MVSTLGIVVTEVPRLPPRQRDANKGTFGRALLLAGSRGMSGAAVLCGSAALRGGAGLVRIATPHEAAPLVAMANPCYMTTYLPQDDLGRIGPGTLAQLHDALAWATVVGVGPGLGQGAALGEALQHLLESSLPLVIDADALNGLHPYLHLLAARTKPTILTPHPGEFSRLTGLDIATIQAHRQEQALRFASQHKVVLVLKGAGTVVTDGERVFINPTGNPGMATGGTGDVLTGLITALLAQGLSAFDAAQLGVYLHGKAGDCARDRQGEVSLIATDLLEELPGTVFSFQCSVKTNLTEH